MRPASSSPTATSTSCSCTAAARSPAMQTSIPPSSSTACSSRSTSTSGPHRAGLLPSDYAALGASEPVGRKLLAAAVQRGEHDLRSVRGVRRELLEAVETATNAGPLHVLRRDEAP